MENQQTKTDSDKMTLAKAKVKQEIEILVSISQYKADKSQRNSLNKWFQDSVKNYFLEVYAAPLILADLGMNRIEDVKKYIHSSIQKSDAKFMLLISNYHSEIVRFNKLEKFKQKLENLVISTLEEADNLEHMSYFAYNRQKNIRKQFVGLLLLQFCECRELGKEVTSFYDLWNSAFPDDQKHKKKLSKYDTLRLHQALKSSTPQEKSSLRNQQSDQQINEKIDLGFSNDLAIKSNPQLPHSQQSQFTQSSWVEASKKQTEIPLKQEDQSLLKKRCFEDQDLHLTQNQNPSIKSAKISVTSSWRPLKISSSNNGRCDSPSNQFHEEPISKSLSQYKLKEFVFTDDSPAENSTTGSQIISNKQNCQANSLPHLEKQLTQPLSSLSSHQQQQLKKEIQNNSKSERDLVDSPIQKFLKIEQEIIQPQEFYPKQNFTNKEINYFQLPTQQNQILLNKQVTSNLFQTQNTNNQILQNPSFQNQSSQFIIPSQNSSQITGFIPSWNNQFIPSDQTMPFCYPVGYNDRRIQMVQPVFSPYINIQTQANQQNVMMNCFPYQYSLSQIPGMVPPINQGIHFQMN